MKVKIIILLTVTLLIITLLAGCLNPFLPIYEQTDEDGTSVYINGVRYTQLPKIKWYVRPSERIIGFAGDRNTLVYAGLGDTDQNFIFLKGLFADYYDGELYRTDRIIPEPADVVDKLMYGDYAVGTNDEYTFITEDADTIKELFEILENGKKTDQFNSIEKDSAKVDIYIGCYSAKLPGAHYSLAIGTNNDGKIICGDRYENEYVEIPIELLEKIAGKELNLEEILID